MEREKQRRIEREREKAERARELNQVKKAHQKELSRLKEKLENSRYFTQHYLFNTCNKFFDKDSKIEKRIKEF